MLNYIERMFLLQGVPTFRVREVRLGYQPMAWALVVAGFGLFLTWLFASKKRNLYEPATGTQALLLGASLMALARSWDRTAEYLFIGFLFVFFTVLMLALLNFKGMNNESIFELRPTRQQVLGYALTLAASVAAYLAAARGIG